MGTIELVDRFKYTIDDDKKQKINQWIDEQKWSISVDRKEVIERRTNELAKYDDFISPVRKGPWEDCSNVRTPLTKVMLDAYVAKLYNIFTQKKTVNFSPREKMDDREVAIFRQLRDWYLYDYINEFRGIRPVLRELCLDVCEAGYGVIFKSWEHKQRKELVIERAQMNELQTEMNELAPQIAENAPRDIKTNIKPFKEVQKIVTAFEGTMLRTIPLENCYFPNDIPESSNLDYPPMVLISTEYDISEIQLKANQGLWDREEAEAIIKTETQGVFTKDQGQSRQIKQVRDANTGYNAYNSSYKSEKRDIEIVFMRHDIDDDNISEDVVITRSAHGRWLSVLPLDRYSYSGRRPLYKFECQSKSRQAYSRCIPELLYSLQMEMDYAHNLRNDALQLQVLPFGAYVSGQGLDAKPVRMKPGRWMPVSDINDIKTLHFNSNAHALLTEEEKLWEYASWMLSINPISKGIVSDNVGPLRSTSGVIKLLNQANEQFKPVIDQFAIQWKALEVGLAEDLDFRVDTAMKLRVLGPELKEAYDLLASDNKFGVASNFLLTKLFDIKVDVADALESEEVKRDNAFQILQMTLTPSLLHQSGIITAKGLLQATKDYYNAWGKNPDDYIDEPELVGKALTLYQETQICGQGSIPPMSMQDNHEEKAALLIQFAQTPQYQKAKAAGLYVADVDSWIMRASEKHKILGEALRPQGPSRPGGGSRGEEQAGVSIQQGGRSPNETTSRGGGAVRRGVERVRPGNEAAISEGGMEVQ